MSWRRLSTLVRREVQATLRDRFTLMILVGVPLFALLLFGFILSTEVAHLGLGVLDADGSRASRELVADLTAQETFRARAFVTREQLEEAMVSGAVSAGLLIPPGYERALRDPSPGRERAQVRVIYDGTEAVLAGNAEGFLQALVASQARGRNGDRSGANADTGAGEGTGDGTGIEPPPAGIEVATRALFNPRLAGEPFMVSGTFGFVLSFLTTLLTALSIVNEKQQGTFEQLEVTPATSLEIFLGKLLPIGAVFTLDVVLMVLLAGLLLDVWPAGSAVFFVLISTFYVLISLSLGLIFSATSATPAEAVQKTVLFSIPLVQLSGFAFPIRNMPLPVRWLTELFPATHYIRLSRAIYVRAAGPGDLLFEMAALFLFGALIVAFALRRIGARA
jgi:ABC-2 type transport system permease protein